MKMKEIRYAGEKMICGYFPLMALQLDRTGVNRMNGQYKYRVIETCLMEDLSDTRPQQTNICGKQLMTSKVNIEMHL